MDDTICAISTALGVGAISIIRISGKESLNIVKKILKNKRKSFESHRVYFDYVVDKKEIIDEVLVTFMRSPKSYTCENVIEINCHGGINTTNKILELLLENGCRLATPGEFTKRAFLNGRIDLTQAEAVNDLLFAKNDKARSLALSGISGILKEKIKILRQKMVELLSNIEVNFDYPEYEDNLIITQEILRKQLKKFKLELELLLASSKEISIIKEGINVCIIGSPNVGKSSLLNAFLNEEKAIVTNIAGTTRDIVEGSISLNGILLNFIDTAGIRETENEIEKMGIAKSKMAMKRADLVILVLDATKPLNKAEKELIKNLRENSIIFVNKNDLNPKIKYDFPFIAGNTKSLEGINKLKEKITNLFNLDQITTQNLSSLSNVRQIDLVKKSLTSLINAEKSLKKDIPLEMIEIDLKKAWLYLGDIIGENYEEELLDALFKNFCLGK